MYTYLNHSNHKSIIVNEVHTSFALELHNKFINMFIFYTIIFENLENPKFPY